ncbi:MAG: putative Na+/H+ antiporter [Vicinamibacterales bacterium]
MVQDRPRRPAAAGPQESAVDRPWFPTSGPRDHKIFRLLDASVVLSAACTSTPTRSAGRALDILLSSIDQQPVNAVATAVPARRAHVCQPVPARGAPRAARLRRGCRAGASAAPQLPRGGSSHFLGEVEVSVPGCGSWCCSRRSRCPSARRSITEHVNAEPMFVVVIMAMAATRPVVAFAQAVLQKVAALGGRTPAARWF